MDDKDKQLLVKDLCARLPYKVKVMIRCVSKPVVLSALFIPDISIVCVKYWDGRCDGSTTIEQVRPYLYPLSSMTEEQRKEYHDICLRDLMESKDAKVVVLHKDADWFEEHHFDYRGLIERGLAIDCTNLNIY